ncbi:hypothetical protein HYH02_015463 [Chlamydomonas schloesseri]|uniref:Uncharacterized protein n=1 Tax=Chlamydomonas schloesseri TaxID=2026947 RepID=A0A835S7P2_9CHLO|nr:hypothetical protein HYH02_015463 [Chlamydomonas schloesseri]|eukprot:KAG2422273.1 hypothetical protein HYH02_015463 [Chlamydomonas schloesseri]
MIGRKLYWTAAEFAGSAEWEGVLEVADTCYDELLPSRSRRLNSFKGKRVAELFAAAGRLAEESRRQDATDTAHRAAEHAARMHLNKTQRAEQAMAQVIAAVPAIAELPAAGDGGRAQPVRLLSEAWARAVFELIVRATDTGAPTNAALKALLVQTQADRQRWDLLHAYGVDFRDVAYSPEVSPETLSPRTGEQDPTHDAKTAGHIIQREPLLPALVEALASGTAPPASAKVRTAVSKAADSYLLSRNAIVYTVLQHLDTVPRLAMHLPLLRGVTDKNRQHPATALLTDWQLHMLLWIAGFRDCATSLSVLGGVYVAHDRRGLSQQLRLQLYHDGALWAAHLLEPYAAGELPQTVRGVSLPFLLSHRYRIDSYWVRRVCFAIIQYGLPLQHLMLPCGERAVMPCHAAATMPFVLRASDSLAPSSDQQGASPDTRQDIQQQAEALASQSLQFAFLKGDGDAEGSPLRLIQRQLIIPWSRFNDRANGTNPVESFFGVITEDGYRPGVERIMAKVAAVEWRLRQYLTPDLGYHPPARRRDRVSYDRHPLEPMGQDTWSAGGAESYEVYKYSAKARADADALQRMLGRVTRKHDNLTVRQFNQLRK